MSSNLRIQRICQYCGSEFTSKTTVTRTCSDKCAKRLYKKKQRDAKIEVSNQQTERIVGKPMEELSAKAFLSISETCKLLSMSRWTIWRAIKRNELNAAKIGKRTLIRRLDIDRLFDAPLKQEIKTEPIQYTIADCYTFKEIHNIYKISDKATYELIERNNIPKLKDGIYAYVPKIIIDKLLS